MKHQQLFDAAHERLLSNDVVGGFQYLGKPLTTLFQQHETAGTANELISFAREHPLFELAQQDPYTSRAFEKPRGYAGDAVMMDYIYKGAPDHEVTKMGAGIFQVTTRVSMGLSVVYRKALLEAHINDTVSLHRPFRILSVASGHCRELTNSLVLNKAFQGEFLALDADPLSCAEVSNSFPDSKVRAIHANIKDLLTGQVEIGSGFDLIYSAGLFDYLAMPVATRLVQSLIKKLSPTGKLLVANFVPQSYGRGYMECFMNWQLIYRTPDQLRELFPASGWKLALWIRRDATGLFPLPAGEG